MTMVGLLAHPMKVWALENIEINDQSISRIMPLITTLAPREHVRAVRNSFSCLHSTRKLMDRNHSGGRFSGYELTLKGLGGGDSKFESHNGECLKKKIYTFGFYSLAFSMGLGV